MEGFFKQYLGEMAAALIAGFGGWFFRRRKQAAEERAGEIENAEKVLRYYREMVDDLGARLKEAIDRLREAEAVIRAQEAKVEALTGELMKYKQLNGKIKDKQHAVPDK